MFGEIRAKHPLQPPIFSCSCTHVSIDGFSDWSSASVCLAEHEKSSSHLQAGVKSFETEQRQTKGCSLDSIHHINQLPLYQTFTVFGCLQV